MHERLAQRWLQSQIKPGLRVVHDEVFYWRSRRLAPIGLTIPRSTPRESPVEDIFEQVRRRVNPQAPSRLDCVFVCPALQGWCRPGRLDAPFIYRVRVTGRVFTTDGGLFTEARFRPENAESWAEGYWLPRGNVAMNMAEESLVDGKVVIEQQIDLSSDADD